MKTSTATLVSLLVTGAQATCDSFDHAGGCAGCVAATSDAGCQCDFDSAHNDCQQTCWYPGGGHSDTCPPAPPSPGRPVVYDNSCRYANDGQCDEPAYCHMGTDCTDCGNCAGGSELPSRPPPRPVCQPATVTAMLAACCGARGGHRILQDGGDFRGCDALPSKCSDECADVLVTFYESCSELVAGRSDFGPLVDDCRSVISQRESLKTSGGKCERCSMTCVFIHGAGFPEVGPPTDSYPEYWGHVEDSTPLCARHDLASGSWSCQCRASICPLPVPPIGHTLSRAREGAAE